MVGDRSGERSAGDRGPVHRATGTTHTRPAEFHPDLANIERIAHTTGFTALDVPLRVGPSYLAIARTDRASATQR